MSSLIQIASQLAERGGKKTDMSFITQMKDLVIIKYGRFLENTLGKKPEQAKMYLQSFVVDLVRVDPSDECDETPDDCDSVLRTKEKIPMPIRYGVHPFDYVGSPYGDKPYGWTTFGNEATLKYLPITGKFARHTYINEYVYIFNKDIEKIRIEGVFPDPRKLAQFRSCNEDGKTCWSEEQEAFIPEAIAALIIEDILVKELRLVVPNNEKILIKEDKNV